MPHLALQIKAVCVAEHLSRQSGLTVLVVGSVLSTVSRQSLCILHHKIATEDLSLMWHSETDYQLINVFLWTFILTSFQPIKT